jgi:hypothetical protein
MSGSIFYLNILRQSGNAKRIEFKKNVSVHFPADWADSHHQANQSKETSLKQSKYININFVDILWFQKVVGGTVL